MIIILMAHSSSCIEDASSFHEAVKLLKEHAMQQHIGSIIEKILAQPKRKETMSRRSVLCDNVCFL